MLKRDPKRVLNAINNHVTVSLPLTSVDANAIAEKIRLEDLQDITVKTEDGKDDGVILVYNKNLEQWQSTKLLNKQNMDGGEY